MKKWLPAQDDFLLMLRRVKKDTAFIANRMGCTQEEVIAREKYLHEQEQGKMKAEPALPTKEEVDKLEEHLDPIQKKFLRACRSYNDLGEQFRYFGELVSGALAGDELEGFFLDCFSEQKQPNETAAQFLARVVSGKAIIIPRIAEPPNVNGVHQNNNTNVAH